MADAVHVTILSDSRLMRDALCSRLAQETGIGSVRAAQRFEELPAGRTTEPGEVFLVDAAGHASSALATIRRVRCLATASRVVAMGIPEGEADTVRYIEAGANGCADRETPYAALLETIRACAAGKASCSLGVLRQVIERLLQIAEAERVQPTGRLTARETQTGQLVAQGLLNKQIAKKLGVKLSTVKTHLRRVAKKLHAPRRWDIARLAFPHGVLEKGVI
jgi:DNA-binding NarL/FixJ family response regulator